MMIKPLPEALNELITRTSPVTRILFVTGAGLGVASGLPTFRGAGGYYNGLGYEQLASRGGFDIHPETTWEWYNERFVLYENAEPNNGHLAIAQLERMNNMHVETATQNVDGLHFKAGSSRVYELHGNLRTIKCTGCKHLEAMFEPFDLDRLYHECGVGKLRPNVVWFCEDLPDLQCDLSFQAAAKADIIVIAGTSSEVYPAAKLVDNRAKDAIVIEINPNPVLAQHKVDYILREGTETGIPRLVDMIITACTEKKH